MVGYCSDLMFSMLCVLWRVEYVFCEFFHISKAVEGERLFTLCMTYINSVFIKHRKCPVWSMDIELFLQALYCDIRSSYCKHGVTFIIFSVYSDMSFKVSRYRFPWLTRSGYQIWNIFRKIENVDKPLTGEIFKLFCLTAEHTSAAVILDITF